MAVAAAQLVAGIAGQISGITFLTLYIYRAVVVERYAEPVYAKTPENPPHCHVPLNDLLCTFMFQSTSVLNCFTVAFPEIVLYLS